MKTYGSSELKQYPDDKKCRPPRLSDKENILLGNAVKTT